MTVRVLVVLTGLLLALLTPVTVAAEPVRILLYGDSITQGSSGDWTWRYRLDRHLRDSGVSFDFVGPYDGLHHFPDAAGAPDEQTYVDPGFDTDHAARWGQALTAPVDRLGDLVEEFRPDMVVSMIGVNDLTAAHATVSGVIDAYEEQIALARAAAPGLDVVVAREPVTWLAGVTDLNAALATMATGLDTPTERVLATDVPAFVDGVDNWDPVHPTATGEVKIAAAVENALSAIGVGDPAGTVVVENGLRATATLTATAGAPGEARLRWTTVPGATAMWLETRDPDVDADWRRYPFSFGPATTQWTATGLWPGHEHRFRIRAAKGTVTSPLTSAVARVFVAASALAAVKGVRAVSRRHDVVTVIGKPVAGATSYDVLAVAAKSCRRMPRPGRFSSLKTGRPAPRARLRTSARHLWVRLVAVRDGVPGRIAKRSTDCVRVR
ncbi:SGNH/GDSL hydrolase family protein [Nocardioides sp.]|uniref:SGNH/GDSL hydrolase family protein n=1 Tax=Nocardioides sp. TaxID=35761 RepID=UPI0039E4C068